MQSILHSQHKGCTKPDNPLQVESAAHFNEVDEGESAVWLRKCGMVEAHYVVELNVEICDQCGNLRAICIAEVK